MKENIGSTLQTLCTSQQTPIRLYLSEAESEAYPYVVYEADYVPYYDKDGVYKIVADVTVRGYSKDHVEAENLASSIDELTPSARSRSSKRNAFRRPGRSATNIA